ncbi:DsbA family protein [Roseibium sp. RKSG952]|uniref:DsbA family protein n=1 Tax=Roseibium sp. RKSG952 TaxID=2529384 RepID=UPI0012BCDA8F|nr:DsbA family protein [Roseibium sp. RKSG952]MTH95159.1 DsbA family protein [Roseibium sp. RKSG952]
MLNRRTLLKTSAALLTSAAFPSTVALAETFNPSEIMKSFMLDDMTIGVPDAPVTVIEYASLTCGHCANFHRNTYPRLKSDFIETGKVRFIMREFPLDLVATAGSMLARSLPADKYFGVVDLMFRNQQDWAFTDNPYESLLALAKQIGFTQETFEVALTNQKLLEDIIAGREMALSKFGVDSTPSFFINGELHKGNMSIETIAKRIESAI